MGGKEKQEEGNPEIKEVNVKKKDKKQERGRSRRKRETREVNK